MWMAWEAQQAEEARLEAEAQNDEAWREWALRSSKPGIAAS